MQMVGRVVLRDLSRSLATTPLQLTDWRKIDVKNKTENEIENAIQELKNGEASGLSEKVNEVVNGKNEKVQKKTSKKVKMTKKEFLAKQNGQKIETNNKNETPTEVKPKNQKVAAKQKAEKMKARLDKGTSRGRGRPSIISANEFKSLWENAKSMNDIAETLSRRDSFTGQDKTKIKLYCSMRASQLRKKGVELKHFPRGRKASK